MGKYLYYTEYSITIESIEIIFRWWSRWDLLSVQNKWLISTTFGYINPFFNYIDDRSWIMTHSRSGSFLMHMTIQVSLNIVFWSSKYIPVSRISDPKPATCHSRTSFSGFLFPSETVPDKNSRPKNPSEIGEDLFFSFWTKILISLWNKHKNPRTLKLKRNNHFALKLNDL